MQPEVPANKGCISPTWRGPQYLLKHERRGQHFILELSMLYYHFQEQLVWRMKDLREKEKFFSTPAVLRPSLT